MKYAAYWEIVERVFHEKIGPAALAAVSDDTKFTEFARIVYPALPPALRLFVPEADFVRFCVAHKERLVVLGGKSLIRRVALLRQPCPRCGDREDLYARASDAGKTAVCHQECGYVLGTDVPWVEFVERNIKAGWVRYGDGSTLIDPRALKPGMEWAIYKDPSEEKTEARFCPSCGIEISTRAKFCEGCGASLGQHAQPPLPTEITLPSSSQVELDRCEQAPEPAPEIVPAYDKLGDADAPSGTQSGAEPTVPGQADAAPPAAAKFPLRSKSAAGILAVIVIGALGALYATLYPFGFGPNSRGKVGQFLGGPPGAGPVQVPRDVTKKDSGTPDQVASASAENPTAASWAEIAGPLAGTSAEASGSPKPGVQTSKSGKQVYASACASCHDNGASGSPRISDPAAWTVALGKGKAQLYASTINGKGAMPARGALPNLSDNEIKAAVDFLVAQVARAERVPDQPKAVIPRVQPGAEESASIEPEPKPTPTEKATAIIKTGVEPMRRELAECSGLLQVICQEKVRWKYCHPDKWDKTPECIIRQTESVATPNNVEHALHQ